MKTSPTLTDYQLLLYLLAKRNGGTIMFTNQELNRVTTGQHNGHLRFVEGPDSGDLVVIAEGD